MIRDEIKQPSGAHVNIQKGEGNAPVNAYIVALLGSIVEGLFAQKGADRDRKILIGSQRIIQCVNSAFYWITMNRFHPIHFDPYQ
ncbi:hypothetical protein [Ochrobactrum soli]|uniref:Uncharacterized protein n=1 Tax=Ochrobactrum soli TaxID=2448455 RepID=A0A849KYF0_9HYPH|nr:hypothetical protein [[Ochrobactrum] soli]NNU63464.1 hypothetical protein [[Ochrobactrum] soli]